MSQTPDHAAPYLTAPAAAAPIAVALSDLPPPPPLPAVPPASPAPPAPTVAAVAAAGGGAMTPTGAGGVDVAPGRPCLERYLASMVINGAPDLHLTPNQVPRTREAGKLLPMAGERALSSAEIEDLMREVLSPYAWNEFSTKNDADTAYSMSTATGAAVTSRFRVNLLRTMGSAGAVIRTIPERIVTLDDLGLLPQIRQLAQLPRGLVLFCGPTGSGKSTSMAALVNEMNETRYERIVTLEDPIEFVHQSKNCLISHREIGEDTPTFAEGLRRVRRQDPDIILVGEMRDYETIAAAIEAADTGHLVLSTLHTNSAPETISRIINSFPAEQQEQIRTTLSTSLKAVICQTLVPSPKSERGRVLANEVMFVNSAIANLIRKNDIPAIVGALSDRTEGNISLDAHLAQLFDQGWITKNEALKKASSELNFTNALGSPK